MLWWRPLSKPSTSSISSKHILKNDKRKHLCKLQVGWIMTRFAGALAASWANKSEGFLRGTTFSSSKLVSPIVQTTFFNHVNQFRIYSLTHRGATVRVQCQRQYRNMHDSFVIDCVFNVLFILWLCWRKGVFMYLELEPTWLWWVREEGAPITSPPVVRTSYNVPAPDLRLVTQTSQLST